MTPERLEHFHAKLRAQLAGADVGIGDAKAHALDPASDESVDRGDDAVRDVLVDTSLGLGEVRTREREEIDDALLRIERGDYGTCEACGNPIELDRLEAVPATRFCKTDARRQETHRRRPTL